MAEAGATGDTIGVLYVHTATLPPLGADTWIQSQIIRHIDRSSHELHVACRTFVGGVATPTYEVVRDIEGIDIVPVDFGPELAGRSFAGKVRGVAATLPALWGLGRLVRLSRRRRVQVVHTSDRPRDAFAAVLIARLTGATSVVHVHVGYNPAWIGRMLQWSLAHADHLVAVSSFVASTLVEGGFPAERVDVVLNAIDVDAWVPGAGRDDVRAELGIGAAATVVATVCRLFPEKGPGDLIEAVARVRTVHPEVVLLIVGKELFPGYRDELETLTARLELGDAVRFLGRRGDVGAVMAAADIFAMPSHEEPFGLVFLEAMAMERPVVALADGGTLEVVDHDRNGLLSSWKDADQLVANLSTLIADPARRAAMGECGRHHVIERFTVQRMAADVAALYRRIAASTR